MRFVSRRHGRTVVRVATATREATRFLNRGRSGALVLGLAAAAALAAPASASASASASNDPSPVVGHVYVNDNTKPANTIGAFDRHADGTLTPEPGSPFWAGGAGTGTGTGVIRSSVMEGHPAEVLVRAARGADMLVSWAAGDMADSPGRCSAQSASTACIMPPVLSRSSEGPAGAGNDQHRRHFQDMRNQRTGSEHAGLPPV